MLASFLLFAQEAVEKVTENAPPPPNFALVVLLIGGFFIFLVVLPAQRRERRQREAVLGGLKRNDEVVTTGGIIGIVQNIKDDEVTLKLEDNAKVRVLKSAIGQIRTVSKDPAADPAAAPKPAT